MEVDITDKGSKHLQSLKEGPPMKDGRVDSTIFDYIVLLNLTEEGSMSVDSLLHGEGYDEVDTENIKSSVRRLFEARYIEVVN